MLLYLSKQHDVLHSKLPSGGRLKVCLKKWSMDNMFYSLDEYELQGDI